MKKDILKYCEYLYTLCDKDTCSEKLRPYYKENNKFLGHCSVVSYFIQKKFGGVIKQVYVKEYDVIHYFNCIDGVNYDPTIVQFKKPVTYEPRGEILPEQLKARIGVGERIDNFAKKLKQRGEN